MCDEIQSPNVQAGFGNDGCWLAEAMRRILVERARRKKSEKHGGKLDRVELSEHDLLTRADPHEILALDDALTVFGRDEPEATELVKLRIFADFSVEEAGKLLGMPRATAYRHWTYARAWLKKQMCDSDFKKSPEINQ